jgi:hypothetical protein
MAEIVFAVLEKMFSVFKVDDSGKCRLVYGWGDTKAHRRDAKHAEIAEEFI